MRQITVTGLTVTPYPISIKLAYFPVALLSVKFLTMLRVLNLLYIFLAVL